METTRLIIDAPLPGPVNMGRDEALLERCGDPLAPPVVRFYAWDPPTISLGYFQDYAEYERLPPPAGGLPVVRRTTGGGAILHDLELTYSIVIPLGHPMVAGRPNHLYELAHAAVIAAIGHGVRLFGASGEACDASAQRGPFFCFARRHGLDVVVGGRREGGHQHRMEAGATPDSRAAPDAGAEQAGVVSKIAGSAQRRTSRAILQHGSIMLGSRYSQQPVATWSGLESEAAGGIGFEEAARRLAPAFARQLGVSLVRDTWRAEELAAAAVCDARYRSEGWTVRKLRT